jgi:hypothetical protein
VSANIGSTALLAAEIVAYKIAQIASQAATAAVTAATWLYNAAITVGQIGTSRIHARGDRLARRAMGEPLATVAVTAAMWLYNAAVAAVKFATTEMTVATVAAKVAQLAVQVATWLASAAQTAYAIVVGVSSGALGLFTGGGLGERHGDRRAGGRARAVPDHDRRGEPRRCSASSLPMSSSRN